MSIPINERFELRRDSHSWMLVEHVAVDQSRKGVKNQSREVHTWHATPEQACRTILERTGGDCETAEGLVREWRKAVSEITHAFEAVEAA